MPFRGFQTIFDSRSAPGF